MLFSLTDLQKALGQETLDHGRVCLETTLVDTPDVMRDGELVTSLVRPPRQKPFRVYIRIQPGENDGLSIRGECSCPGRGDCEHVAAVLIKALEEIDEIEREDPAEAEQTSPGLQLAAAQYPPNVHQRLLYLLIPALEGILLRTVSARQVDDDRFENIREYEPAWAARRTPPRFLLPVDLELLSELSGLTPVHGLSVNRTMRQLEGKTGGTLLQRVLETGRACWQDVAQRLVLAEPRPVAFDWQADRQGNQHLIIQSDPPSALCFSLDAPWYLDPAAGHCGPLKGELPVELLTLPPVAPDRVAAVEADLAERYAQMELPPLRRFELEELPSGRPVPVVRFENRESITLSFEYQGIGFSGREHSRLWKERVCKVNRHWTFEQRCREQLHELGLERTAGEEECFTFEGGAREWYLLQARMLTLLQAPQPAAWRTEYDPAFPYRLAEVQQWSGEISASAEHGWFSFGIGALVDGKRVDLLPALIDLIQTMPMLFNPARLAMQDPEQPVIVPLEAGRTVAIPMGRIRRLIETLFELYDVDELEDGCLRLNRFQITRLLELDTTDHPMAWSGGEALRDMARRLRGFSTVPEVAPPAGLKTQLRGYQQQGLNWLQFLREYDLAGILADDMGLGKTVQLLAHLLLEKEQGRVELPSLVVVPTSLLANWRREAAAFVPDLRVKVLHGPDRHEQFKRLNEFDLLITSYGLLSRDEARYLDQPLHLLILDEAQAIKNPKTQASRILRRLTANHRICMTGTPLENHLGELWSLFDFLLPGLLGGQRSFRTLFRRPIEEEGNETVTLRLAQRVGPFLLRRTKAEVLKELPPKIEIERSVELEGEQRELYEDIRLAVHERVRKEVGEHGMARSNIIILDALLKLRQVCCDPRLLKMEAAQGVEQSAKLELLMELLPKMIEEGRRILLYSQFTSMLELIEQAVTEQGIQFAKLTGATHNRTAQIDRFQNGEVPLFLISLKAGGVGLNLTAADTVIHYDPWWNPAVERQASDRAHRIGQKNPVFVYKLLSQGTVEEKIQTMQLRKQALADSLFEHKTRSGSQLTEKDLELLFESLE